MNKKLACALPVDEQLYSLLKAAAEEPDWNSVYEIMKEVTALVRLATATPATKLPQ